SLQGEVSTRGARKGNPLRACAAPQRPLLPCTRTTSESPHACGPLLGSPFHVEHSEEPFHACGALPGPAPCTCSTSGASPRMGGTLCPTSQEQAYLPDPPSSRQPSLAPQPTCDATAGQPPLPARLVHA